MCPTRTWRKEIDIVENKKIQLKKNTHILQITPPGLSYRFIFIYMYFKDPSAHQSAGHAPLPRSACLALSLTHTLTQTRVCTVQGPGSGSELSCYSRPRPQHGGGARKGPEPGPLTPAERETEQPIPLRPSGRHGNYIHPLFTPVLQKRSVRPVLKECEF